MSSSTRWTSRALVAAGAGGLLVLGAVFGPVGAASADDTPPTTAARERPRTLPPTTASLERPTRGAPGRPGRLTRAAAPAEPAPGTPNYTG